MKDNLENGLAGTAEAAEAEKDTAAADLGKFKDVKALMEAYRALEAEFTRRSQRLKELEASKEQGAPAQDAASGQAPSQGQGGATVTPEEKNAIIEEYLNGVRANRGVPFVTGGGAVAAERRTPTTMREAGMLAKNFFIKKEN